MSELMLFTVVVVAALALASLVLHSLARRSEPVTDPPVLPLSVRPVEEAPCGSKEHAPVADPCAWQSATVSELCAAEELLDWAEAEGYQDRELLVLGGSTFLVRWRGRLEAGERDD